MRRFAAQVCFIIALSTGAAAAADPQFPALTGRVVDDADLLSPDTRERLTRVLEKHEKETSNQVVVVTLPSLQGYPIEDFGYQLGRHWSIGQKGKDNGVLLIVAPNERRVRIEVGYGLEGALTDALSQHIIQNEVLPAFRQQMYERGIVEGTEAVLAALEGTYRPTTVPGVRDYWAYALIVMALWLTLVLWNARQVREPRRTRTARRPDQEETATAPDGWRWGDRDYDSNLWSSGGSSGGGGFSGGGGSFGGGGASGRW